MELKKRVLFLLFGAVLIFNICNVYAGLGITPATTKVDFQPNMSFLVNFNVLSASPGTNLMVYADGDLSQYVSFDKTLLTGREGFTAYIDLPNFINKSGKNRLYIKVKEYSNESSGISALLEVGALITIKVPYPGKYAEINSFSVNNVNEGEPIRFYLELNNLGSEEINPSVNIEVYSENKLFDSYSLGAKKIAANTIDYFEINSGKKEYRAGSYHAIFYVNLNDEDKTILKANTTFFVGNLFIDIINYTKEVNKSKINPFNIGIESKWNNDLKNVYAEVNVSKDGKEADFFKTPSIELKKWEKANLRGFFNAEELEEGTYKANITLYYDEKQTTKIVDVNVVSPETPKKRMILIIIAIIIVVIAIMIIIAFYLLYRKKNEKRKKK